MYERVSWKIVAPRKPMSTEAKPRLTLVFEGDNSPCYLFVQSIFIILLLFRYAYHLRCVWFQKQSRSSEYLCWYTSYMYIQTPIRIQLESMVNRTLINYAQSIFFGISPVVKQYHPLLNPITCSGVVQRVILIFIKMSLSQSESTILHERIIM